MGAPEMHVGNVLWRGLVVLSRAFVPFVLIGAATSAVPFWYSYEHLTTTWSWAMVVSAALSIMFRGLCEASIVYAALQALSGDRVQPAVSIARGLRRIVPVLVTSLLICVTTSVGFVLLFIPGLIAMTALFVAIPACVADGLGPVESVERSFALTDGYRWHTFGVLIAVVAVSAAVHWLLIWVIPREPGWLLPATAFGWTALVEAYDAVLVAVVYNELRNAPRPVTASRSTH